MVQLRSCPLTQEYLIADFFSTPLNTSPATFDYQATPNNKLSFQDDIPILPYFVIPCLKSYDRF